MIWWRRIKRWFRRVFLGEVDPGVYVADVPITERPVPIAPMFEVSGEFERGPIGETVLITSFSEFQEKFGGIEKDLPTDIAQEAYQFFLNGGHDLHVTRVYPVEDGRVDGKRNKLQEIFDLMPTSGSVDFFDNEMFVGICIKWSEKGRGFGEYTFSVDKRTGEFRLDNEADGPDTVWQTIERIIDTEFLAIKRMFLQMMCAAKVDDDSWPVPLCPPKGEGD